MNVGYFLVDAEIFIKSESFYKKYLGIDRCPWMIVDEKCYGNGLPESILRLRREMFDSNIKGVSFGLVGSIDELSVFCKSYEKHEKKKSQIVAIGFLEEVCNLSGDGGFDEIIGVDVYVDGYGSLINLGAVARPEIFAEHINKLNSNGLFCSGGQAKNYVDFYLSVAKKENLEFFDTNVKIFAYKVVNVVDF